MSRERVRLFLQLMRGEIRGESLNDSQLEQLKNIFSIGIDYDIAQVILRQDPVPSQDRLEDIFNQIGIHQYDQAVIFKLIEYAKALERSTFKEQHQEFKNFLKNVKIKALSLDSAQDFPFLLHNDSHVKGGLIKINPIQKKINIIFFDARGVAISLDAFQSGDMANIIKMFSGNVKNINVMRHHHPRTARLMQFVNQEDKEKLSLIHI